LVAPLAEEDPEVGRAVAVVDVRQRAESDRGLVGAVVDGEVGAVGTSATAGDALALRLQVKGMTQPLPLATSRSLDQRW
jgi:hypothetical protein